MAASLILATLTAGMVGLTPPSIDRQSDVLLVGEDCGDAAARGIADTGGHLLSAQPAPNGKACIITVLVQGKGNERPRRVRVKVPI